MEIETIASQFAVEGIVFNVEPLGHGNVNDTYLAIYRTVFDETRLVLQRINTNVFKEPAKLMSNMHLVTSHVHKVFTKELGESDRIWQLPKIIPTKSGEDYFVDDEGNYWRAITQIASARSYEKIRNAEHAFEVGCVLGEFHHAISDIDSERLYDTLPGFHVTPNYMAQFDAVLKTKIAQERLKNSKVADNLHKFIEHRRNWCSVLEDAYNKGELIHHAIHGDPKTANIMIDDVTGKGTSIIDLDTVKPGLIHYDIGDCLRSCCNPAGEETRDFTSIHFDIDLCAALIRGYKSTAHDFLSDADRFYLFDAVRLITYELALRFFTDHLAGDVYFKIRETGQNLLRARVQAQLCRSIEANESQIRRVLGML